MVKISDISARDWSPKIGRYGEIVTNVEDIKQALMICWLTPYGSVPIRRTFGSRIHRFVDKPYPVAKSNVPIAAVEAAQWEPRAAIDSVTVTQTSMAGMSVLIKWHPVDAPESPQQTEITSAEIVGAANNTAVWREAINAVIQSALDTSDFMRKSEYASNKPGTVLAAEKLRGNSPNGTEYTTEFDNDGRIISNS
jgi:phage baseplate assembly protein W